MLKEQITVGKTYAVRLRGHLVPATVLGTVERMVGRNTLFSKPRTMLHYSCRNEYTNYPITIKSAAKFRYPVTLSDAGWVKEAK